METTKKLIYEFLDRNYPIDGNVIDMSFNHHQYYVVNEVFGVTEINFLDWAYDRVGERFVLYSDNEYIHYKNKQIHNGRFKPARYYYYDDRKMNKQYFVNNVEVLSVYDSISHWVGIYMNFIYKIIDDFLEI